LLIAAAGWLGGCGGEPNTSASGNSATPPKGEPPKLTLLDADSVKWTRDEAVEHLADQKLAVSAAIRLVRLSEVDALCVPEILTDELVKQLRVVSLGEGVWALGLAVRGDMRALQAPVLIDAAGEAVVVADGTEEEVLLLHRSEDADVYPHVLISPLRVWVVNTVPPELALTLDAPPPIGFRAQTKDGLSYIGLMRHGADGWEELASYRWQPYEFMFAGPASDALPDPPGGKFELDMEQSPLLIPVGGEIPPPKPNRMPERPVFGPDWDA